MRQIDSDGPTAMGDRAAQIRLEWFVKCASVVLQARVPSPSPAAAAGKAKQNRWVRPRGVSARARCRSGRVSKNQKRTPFFLRVACEEVLEKNANA